MTGSPQQLPVVGFAFGEARNKHEVKSDLTHWLAFASGKTPAPRRLCGTSPLFLHSPKLTAAAPYDVRNYSL